MKTNSSINQRIKGDFVAREVKTCFSFEMEEILKASAELDGRSTENDLPVFDDIENLYVYSCPECGHQTINQEDFDNGSNEDTHPHYKCPLCEKELEELPDELEGQEILEWWIVTDYLYRKLKEKGEPVLEWGNNYYWGRTCSGQAILLDGVISEICSEMEILDGQANSWAEK